MAKGLLAKLFGGTPPEVPELAEPLAELARLRQERPVLASSCAVLEEILPALFAGLVEASSTFDDTHAGEKLAQGIPLLRGERVNFDSCALRRRWLAICQAIGTQRELSNGEETVDGMPAVALAEAFTALDPPALLAEVLAGRPETVHSRADALGMDAGLTAMVLRLAAFPVLAKISAAVEGMVQERGWDHGHCPICGSWPLLGELRGLEQTRFLRCGLCAADWQFPRLRCPFCDNRDHRLLGFFHVEREENRCRAATCDACSGYLKTVFTLSKLAAPQLLVADLACVHLDLAAGIRGFLVP